MTTATTTPKRFSTERDAYEANSGAYAQMYVGKAHVDVMRVPSAGWYLWRSEQGKDIYFCSE